MLQFDQERSLLSLLLGAQRIERGLLAAVEAHGLNVNGGNRNDVGAVLGIEIIKLDRVYFAATHHDAEDAGFDDAHIYREVKLKPTERSIQFIKVDHSQGADPFKRWIEKEDKNRY